MIEKYYNGVIEQVMDGIGHTEHNCLMVRYNTDFSIRSLESVQRYAARKEVSFVCHEFTENSATCGYEPYLSIVRDMFRRFGQGTFSDFMDSCGVYELQKPVFQGYYKNGVCQRNEPVLLDEVQYEQSRMIQALTRMLLALSEKCPLLLVMNRCQLAPKSTLLLTQALLDQKAPGIGIVLGAGNTRSIPEFLRPDWDSLTELLDGRGCLFHIGGSGLPCAEQQAAPAFHYEDPKLLQNISNLLELLDFDQAYYVLNQIDRKIKFDNLLLSPDIRFQLDRFFAYAAILTRDLSKALEVCEDMERLQPCCCGSEPAYTHDILVATAYMYLGKLKEAMLLTEKAEKKALAENAEFWYFHLLLLKAKIQMSGWCNIFFCAQDVSVSPSLTDRLNRYHFQNHLAHIYIYAYDNDPEMVAKAYHDESSLIYFSRGVSIAREIGNEQLLNDAYQKNIMLSSTNGHYQVALLYLIRTYEAAKNHDSMDGGRIYSAIAYNLCAMGQVDLAWPYYKKALRIFYQLKLPEDIAEVHYNMGLCCIMKGEYSLAENYLQQSMKVVEKLRLNSLRVCNLSKLYGLLALVAVLQGNRFRCERSLYSCRQFLDYILEDKKGRDNLAVIHDYAKSDDDLFLYTFSQALLLRCQGDDARAMEHFEKAQDYLFHAFGNQFFSYALFKKEMAACLKALGRQEEHDQEMAALSSFQASRQNLYNTYTAELLDSLPRADSYIPDLSSAELDSMLYQVSMTRAYHAKKQQLDFISTWQKLIDVTDAASISASGLLSMAMKAFLNHFHVDRALYVRYKNRRPNVLYNNTNVEMTEETLREIELALRKTPEGFAVSKISSNYAEHLHMVSIFGREYVCSMVAIPFFNNTKIDSFLITYVLMKDNWHSSVNRYMLNDDDLSMYRLLFREVRYSLNRLYAYEKIFEMNKQLYLSAVTDQLTGIFNREGFYREISDILERMENGRMKPALGLMFIDLDNFKHYNDTFGHDVGDFILKRMADIFKEICEGKGFVCRYGGDEFLITFYMDDQAELISLAQKIYRILDDSCGFEKEISGQLHRPLTIEKKNRITCSIGISTASDIQSEEDITQMIKRADRLLYSIKDTVKGTYRI